uniref:hypothetical protein n=1 Tax=Burkholderia arboris TaxID=488730 RepID=UPI003BEEE65B
MTHRPDHPDSDASSEALRTVRYFLPQSKRAAGRLMDLLATGHPGGVITPQGDYSAFALSAEELARIQLIPERGDR